MINLLKDKLVQGKTLLIFTVLQVIGQVLTMAVPLVIALWLSKEGFNAFTRAEVIVLLFGSLLIISAKAPFIVHANQERVQTSAIRKSFCVQCIFLVASLAIYAMVSILFFNQLNAFTKLNLHEYFLMGIAFTGLILKDFTSNIFMALSERTKSALVDVCFGVSAVLLIFLWQLSNPLTLNSIFLIYGISGTIVLIAGAAIVNWKLLLPLEFDRSHFNLMFRFTMWSIAGTAAVYLMNSNAIIIMNFNQTTANQVGTFNIAYKCFKGFITLIFILPAYFLPFISENITDPTTIRIYLYKKRPLLLLLGWAALLLVFIILPPVLSVIAHGKFAESVPALRMLLIATFFFYYISFYGPIINALKRYKFIQITTIGQLLVNIGLSIILIPPYGMYGAALATLFSYVFLTVAIEIYYRLKLQKIVIPTTMNGG